MLAGPLIAAEQLSRNDYLLTVALLTIASMYGRTQKLFVEPTITSYSTQSSKSYHMLRKETIMV
jgi:hypothetical protein